LDTNAGAGLCLRRHSRDLRRRANQTASGNRPPVGAVRTWLSARYAGIYRSSQHGSACSASAAGIVLVPVLQFSLRKTIKEAVATSTFMLGTSAAVALIPYVNRGNVPFAFVPFAALGTVTGAYIGSRLFHKIESLYIKILFAAAMLYTAYSMS